MKAIEFKEQNVIIAKDQKEYQPLPALVENGYVVCCFELTKGEINDVVANKGTIKVSTLVFGGPAQPRELRTIKPEFPIQASHMPMNCNPESIAADKNSAVLTFELSEDEIAVLKKQKKIWVITATYNSALQPISLTLRW